MYIDEITVFDTETTGGTNAQNRIIQIAATNINPSNDELNHICMEKREEAFLRHCKVNMRTATVDPGCRISPRASAVHGLTDSDVKGLPPLVDVIDKIIDRIPKGSVLLAHNMPHDARLLYLECLRFGNEYIDWFNSLEAIDTLAVSKDIFDGSDEYGKKHNLDVLCSRMGVSIDESLRHSASGDTYGLALCWFNLIDKIKSCGLKESCKMEPRTMLSFIHPSKLESDLGVSSSNSSFSY